MANVGRIVVQGVLVTVLGAAALGSTLALRSSPDYKFLDPIIEAQHLITSRYVEQPDLKKLQEGAIKGMIEALNDPYTVFVPASNATEFAKDLLGEYVGIGAQITINDGWLEIISPLEDSPSFRAGLMAEDRVLDIDGFSTYNAGVEECMKRLMGEPGTKVSLTIERKGQKINVELVRAKIKTRSVKGYHREDADGNRWMYLIDGERRIAYLRLTQFTPKCAEEVLAAMRAVGADQGRLNGLVLDLRFNPGGILGEAVQIADLFLKSGKIVSTRGRVYEEETALARDEGTLPEFPIAVLLNGSSASASEVLAGALVENNRAIVVGSRSFGKGSVQTVRPLERGGGAELKLTEQGYFLPSGRSITRKDDSSTWGVDPSDGFYVPVEDRELLEMLDVRRKLEILRPENSSADADSDGNWTSTDWVLERLKDKQLTAAVRALQARVDTGAWKPTGETLNQDARVAAGEINRLRLTRDRLDRELSRTESRLDVLERGAPAPVANARDLVPDGVDLTGGAIKIYDKDGKVIAALDITGNDLERWLIDADVKPAAAPPAAAPEQK